MQLIIKPCDVPHELVGRESFRIPFVLTDYLDFPCRFSKSSPLTATFITYRLQKVKYDNIEREVYILEGFEKQVFAMLNIKFDENSL